MPTLIDTIKNKDQIYEAITNPKLDLFCITVLYTFDNSEKWIKQFRASRELVNSEYQYFETWVKHSITRKHSAKEINIIQVVFDEYNTNRIHGIKTE